MEILNDIKQAVLSIEPEAEVYLFGSRARGTHSEDSDWDVLVLLPENRNYRFKNMILNELYNVEIKYSVLLNILFRKFSTWNNDKYFQVTPFYKNVIEEYIKL